MSIRTRAASVSAFNASGSSTARVRSPSECAVASRSQSPRLVRGSAVAAEPVGEQDLLEQHVRYFLRQNPKEGSKHTVERISTGLYMIDGQEVEVEWQHADTPGQPGHLVVVDGPLRQPFSDYLVNSEANAVYDTGSIAKTSALHHVPKERRMTFDDTHKKYTRLEAMKVAKEQASIREKAADYTKQGCQVPDDLVRKYNKALRQKLRRGQAREGDTPPPRDENTNPAPNEARACEPKAGKEAGSKAPQPPPPPVPPPVEPQAMAPPMAPRGISLNGLPSYVPPPQVTQAPAQPVPSVRISRSWSGTSMPPGSTVPSGMPSAMPSALIAMPGVAMPSHSQGISSLPSARLCSGMPGALQAQPPMAAVAVATATVAMPQMGWHY